MSNQVRPDHSGRLCAAEIDVLLRPWASFSPGRAMTWALEELLCRGHFVRVSIGGAGVPGRLVAYRVTVSPVPRSARPALASFAPLFDGHPRDITAQGLADYVAREFGDELEVEHGYPCGSPLHWYERFVVDPLRAEGLVSARERSSSPRPTARLSPPGTGTFSRAIGIGETGDAPGVHRSLWCPATLT